MKRSIEAHTTLYLTLLRTLIFNWYSASQKNKDTKYKLDERFTKEATSEGRKEQVELVQNIFKESGILTKMYSFGDVLENQGRFFMNYMLIVENLILFIRASREGLWMLYLSLLNDFAKYFFAHDQLNYTRLTPLYFADVTKLEEDDKDTWD